jgi:beta-glucanase (GH16 family)
MRYSIYILLLITLFTTSTQKSFSQCFELIWEDNFEGNTLNTSKWTKEVNDDGGGNNELQFYTDRDTNVSVDNGFLKITALKEEYQTRSYTSARILTEHKGDWRYGRMEARIKMPEGQGIWPAFWMLPTEKVYGTWPNSGEIDIAELVGGGVGDSTIYGTLHYGPPWQFTNGNFRLPDGKFSDNFHVFAVEWDADTIKWFVDDVMYSYKTEDDVTHWLPFQEKFHLILNLAVGGNWPGSPDESTVFPQVMEVDYVRVYGSPDDQEITTIDSAYALGAEASYSFTQAPGANFNWNVGGDAMVLSPVDSNVFSLQWGCDTSTVLLNVQFPQCGSYDYKLPVTFAKPKIEGPLALLQNSKNQNFNLPVIDSSDYSWSYPADAFPVSGESSFDLALDWGCEAGWVKSMIANRCGTFSDSVFVDIIDPVLAGPSTVIANSEGVNYSITSLPDAAYTWFAPMGADIVSGQGTPAIKVDFSETGGNIKIEYQNVCGLDSIVLPIIITDTIILCDYESSFLEFLGWEDGVEPYWSDNKVKDAMNNSDHIGVSFKAESPWSGLYCDLGYNLDLSLHNRFSVLVYGPKAGNVLLKIEDIGEGIPVEIEDAEENEPVEVAGPYSTPGSWQEIMFDFTGTPSGIFDRITLFFDFGIADSNTYYFDDIKLIPSDTIYAHQSNIDAIIEGEENGKRILVQLLYDKFEESLFTNNWSFSNLPEGVSIGSLERLSKDSVLVYLSGNASVDYDNDIIDFTTVIGSSELYKSENDIIISEGVVFTAKSETSIKQNSIEELVIAPNPVENICHITAGQKILNVKIYTLDGKLLMEKTNCSNELKFDLSHLDKGVFILSAELENASALFLQKIIKD